MNYNEGFITSIKQFVILIFSVFAIPLICITFAITYILSEIKNDTSSIQEINNRIKPVALLNFQDISTESQEIKTGEQVYRLVCASCHDTGIAGAPKFNSIHDWTMRINKGYAALLKSVLIGKDAMPPRGGATTEFSDKELERAMIYLSNSAGGKFREKTETLID